MSFSCTTTKAWAFFIFYWSLPVTDIHKQAKKALFKKNKTDSRILELAVVAKHPVLSFDIKKV